MATVLALAFGVMTLGILIQGQRRMQSQLVVVRKSRKNKTMGPNR